MPRIVKGGLVRASTPSDTDLGTIKQARVDKHISLIGEAGRQEAASKRLAAGPTSAPARTVGGTTPQNPSRTDSPPR